VPLPPFNEHGDLPIGIHQATLQDVVERFGSGSAQRIRVTRRLEQVIALARETGKVGRLIVFGSYITAKPDPNDVDVILVMRDDFKVREVHSAATALFDHQRADAELGASIFWTRPSLLVLDTIEDFLSHWQNKRDGTKRGIVEVRV
jgi:hypothetical protein